MACECVDARAEMLLQVFTINLTLKVQVLTFLQGLKSLLTYFMWV